MQVVRYEGNNGASCPIPPIVDTYEKVLAAWVSEYGVENRVAALIYNKMGCGMSDPAKVFDCFCKALSLNESLYGRVHPEVALSY